ncbi:MAG: nitroreductase family protein [Lachnospiraceae bacterium]|nr:nitroreductase family protein [Lachnospiraceae bacterium]
MDSIQKRRSIRKYKDMQIDKSDIEKIVQAGILAPSAKNRQPWKYIVYCGDSKEKLLDKMESGLIREESGEASLPFSSNGLPDAFHTLKIMRQAPVLIMILNTNGVSIFEKIRVDERVTEICDSLSIGASVENMLLKATELGIGSLWIANTCFAYKELVEFIGTEKQLVGAVALGYADEFPNARPRKELEEVVEFRE